MSRATEYCNNVFDGTHDSPKPCKTGHKLLTSKNIMNGYIDKTDSYYISDEDYNAINKRSQVKQWDILFSMIGTVGNVCIITDKEIDFAIKNMGVFSCKNEYEAKWLYFYLQSNYVKRVIQNYLNGAVQKFLPLGKLRDFEIPDFDESKKQIVDLLWNIETKIRNNEKIITELQSMAKTIYDYWFLQYEFPNQEGKPYKSSGGKMEYNEELKKEIPEGWKVNKAGEVISVVRGISYKPKDEIKEINKDTISLLKSNNIQNGSINFEQPVYLDKKMANEDQWLTKGSVFITMSSGSKAHMGKTAIVYETLPYVYGAFCAKINIKPSHCGFISTYFRSSHFRTYIENVTLGTNINNISNDQLTNIKLAFPEEIVLEKFEKIIKPIFEKQGKIIFENQELTKLRDELLPLLMNGQVSFKN